MDDTKLERCYVTHGADAWIKGRFSHNRSHQRKVSTSKALYSPRVTPSNRTIQMKDDDYDFFCQVINVSSLGWNSETRRFEGSESAWNTYIGVSDFRNGSYLSMKANRFESKMRTDMSK